MKDALQVTSSEQAWHYFLETWDWDEMELRECFKVMFLNRNNLVKGIYIVSQGGHSGTFVDVKLVFSVALKTMSSGIILAHNHPSQNTHPSDADTRITHEIMKGCKLLNIAFLDHIILTSSRKYYSFADEGKL